MLTCKITDFSRPSQTVKSSCRARFSVTLYMDEQPLVEIHNCVLLYNQKLQASLTKKEEKQTCIPKYKNFKLKLIKLMPLWLPIRRSIWNT